MPQDPMHRLDHRSGDSPFQFVVARMSQDIEALAPGFRFGAARSFPSHGTRSFLRFLSGPCDLLRLSVTPQWDREHSLIVPIWENYTPVVWGPADRDRRGEVVQLRPPWSPGTRRVPQPLCP
jgi:hypothetical protein